MANDLVFREIARAMFERAISTSASQLRFNSSAQLIEGLHRGQCYRCQVLRLNLARQVAEYLSVQDRGLQGIYFYDPEYASGNYAALCNEPSVSSGINLIAWTRAEVASPKAAMDDLSEAFNQLRSSIVCDKASGFCYSLNVTVVNDAQVKRREGYAAIIGSMNAAATQIWTREGMAD